MTFAGIMSVVLCGQLAPSRSLPWGHPTPSKQYPQYPGFSLWLVEEFDEPLDLDVDPIWTWSDGGLSEGQVRFVRDGIRFEDGRMLLEVREGTQATRPQSCSHAEKQYVAPKPLTSGELRTRYNLFRYGLYEVRMRAPSVQPSNTQINGNYVSTMFVFRDPKFIHWREIDIEVTGDSESSVTMNVLNADSAEAWSPNIQETTSLSGGGVNTRADFHTYAFEWLPDRITWYLDGQVIGRRQQGQGLPIPDKSAKIMMNLWIFGDLFSFGGAEGWNNRYPMQSEYDWFRFHAWDGDSRYPCMAMDESCLTQDDLYLSGNNPCDHIAPQPCTATCFEALRAQGHSNATLVNSQGQWILP